MYLITNGKVITRDSANPYYEDGGVVVEGNKIVEVGDDLTLKLKYPYPYIQRPCQRSFHKRLRAQKLL